MKRNIAEKFEIVRTQMTIWNRDGSVEALDRAIDALSAIFGAYRQLETELETTRKQAAFQAEKNEAKRSENLLYLDQIESLREQRNAEARLHNDAVQTNRRLKLRAERAEAERDGARHASASLVPRLRAAEGLLLAAEARAERAEAFVTAVEIAHARHLQTGDYAKLGMDVQDLLGARAAQPSNPYEGRFGSDER